MGMESMYFDWSTCYVVWLEYGFMLDDLFATLIKVTGLIKAFWAPGSRKAQKVQIALMPQVQRRQCH